MLKFVLLLSIFTEPTSASQCSATKQLYQSMSCCGGESTGTVAEVADFCIDHISNYNTTRIGSAVDGDGRAHNSLFSSVTSRISGGIRFVKTLERTGVVTPSAPGLPSLNFMRSTAIHPKYFLAGVRETPAFIPNAAAGLPFGSNSGIYKLNRTTLATVEIFKGPGTFAGQPVTDFVTRYAPLITDGGLYTFGTNMAFGFSGPALLCRVAVEDFTQHNCLNVGADLNPPGSFGWGLNGPIGSATAHDDATCGTRVFVSDFSFGYFSPFNSDPQTRSLGMDALHKHRGRVQCYCSKTMTPCWDSYYFNGKSGGMTDAVTTVASVHVNPVRSDHVATIRQLPCTDIATPISADKLIGNFTVELGEAVSPGTILVNAAATVRLHVVASRTDVCPKCVDVTYDTAHWNTPVLNMALVSAGGSITTPLVAVSALRLLHAYTTTVTPPDFVSATKASVITALTSTTHSITSFTDPVDLSSLSTTCSATLAHAAIVTGFSGETTDFSGITLFVKLSVGETVPVDGQAGLITAGGDFWNACANNGETLFCPSGNAHAYSVDRHFVMKPVLDLQFVVEAETLAAAQAGNRAAFETAVARQTEVLALYKTQLALLSPFDAAFKEDAVHAIDTKTGTLKWSTAIEGVDNWLQSSMNHGATFDAKWTSLASETFAVQIWKDADINFVALDEGHVLTSSKGGRRAILDVTTGAVVSVSKWAVGTAAGTAAPGNYQGNCVTQDGIMVSYGSLTGRSAASNAVWVTQTGEILYKNQTIVTAYNTRTQTLLWEKAVNKNGGAGPIHCVEHSAIALCPSGTNNCNYDILTGAVLQEFPEIYSFNAPGEAGNSLYITGFTGETDGDEILEYTGGVTMSKWKIVSPSKLSTFTGGVTPSPPPSPPPLPPSPPPAEPSSGE